METLIHLTDEVAENLINRTDSSNLKEAILRAIQFTLDNY
jgi:hypothetical protein